MSKFLLVYNYPVNDITSQWLYKGLKSKKYDVEAIGMGQFYVRFNTMESLKWVHLIGRILLAGKAVIRAKNNNVTHIIVWDNTFVGLATSVWCSLLRYSGNLFILNMIDHGSKLKALRRKMYKFFSRNGVFVSVNNNLLLEKYSREYNIPKHHFFIMPDTCSNQDFILKMPLKDEHYVFSGGTSNRNWKCFIEVAKLCPKIKFIGVARRTMFTETQIPQNVKMYFDTSFDVFFQLLANCSFVFLPLSSHIQAGQTVVIQAGLMKKTVVISKTDGITSYIDKSNGVMYDFDADYQSIAAILSDLYSDVARYQQLGENLSDSMKIHTPEYVVDVLCNKIKETCP